MTHPTDSLLISRDELVHGLTAMIMIHRTRPVIERIKIGQSWDPQPAAAEAEHCAEVLITHVQTLRAARPK